MPAWQEVQGPSVRLKAGWWVLEDTPQEGEINASLYVNALKKGLAREFGVEQKTKKSKLPVDRK